MGSYKDASGREQPATLEIAGDRARLMPALSGAILVSGTLDARGLVERREVRGRVHAGPFTTRYELDVPAGDGRSLRLVGEQRTKLSNPVFSASSVRAELFDAEGVRLAELVLRLDYRRSISRFLTL